MSRKVVGSGSLRSSTDTSEKAHREKPKYPTPPDSSRSEKFPDFDAAYNPPSNRFSTTTASTQIPTSTGGVNSTTTGDNESTRPRRTSSLSQRYPGDTSHRPLDMLRKSDKAAHRSPHLRKQHHVGADTIDNLDTITGTAYHHEGPYDAAMTARNRGAKNAPLAALAGSNAEALRATPREKVLDALEKHYPLDGTAVVPPGMVDREGRLFRYEEGTDMMRELNPGGGPYRRWAHVVSSLSPSSSTLSRRISCPSKQADVLIVAAISTRRSQGQGRAVILAREGTQDAQTTCIREREPGYRDDAIAYFSQLQPPAETRASSKSQQHWGCQRCECAQSR